MLTGGGTAGHVTPNLALLPGLKARGFEIRYIGSYNGMEKGIIEGAGIEYHGISTGKFRRNLSLKNVTDVGRVVKGLGEARKLLSEIKPDIVFSKGGFVSVPVVRAAKSLGIPVILHESDMTPGLANKLCYNAAIKCCCNFPETLQYLPEGKGVLSGSPMREDLFTGSREAGLKFCGFDGSKPVLLKIGGSLGATHLSQLLEEALDDLLPEFDIINLCGRGNLNEALVGRPGYVQFEYITEELKDLYACADIIYSRAGANVLCELLALKKPNLLVPLGRSVSRGDQLLNAESFKKQGFSMVIEEEVLNKDNLAEALRELYQTREKYVKAMEESKLGNGVDVILGLIDEVVK